MGCTQSSHEDVSLPNQIDPLWTVDDNAGRNGFTIGPKHDKVYVTSALRTYIGSRQVALELSKSKGIVLLTDVNTPHQKVSAVCQEVPFSDKYRVYRTQPVYDGQQPFKNKTYQQNALYKYGIVEASLKGEPTYANIKINVKLVYRKEDVAMQLTYGPAGSYEKYLHSLQKIPGTHNSTTKTLVASWKYSYDTRLNHVTMNDNSGAADVGLLLCLLVIADMTKIVYGYGA